MRSDIAPGGTFPDYELPDHTNVPRTLSELQGADPMILTLARGHYCPKEHQQHLELAAFQPKIAVAYTQIVTISTDEHHELQEFRASVGAQWTFLSDPGRTVQQDLDIQEYTDPDHDPMIPHTLVLKPGLVVHSIYNGYWFWGRPSVDDLWRDLRAATSEIRPDWDLSTPGLRAAWDAGDWSQLPRVGSAGRCPTELPEPRLTLVYRLEVTVAPPLDLGDTDRGHRRIVTQTGGRFTGRISGTLLPGASADWQLILADGTALGDIRYTLESDDGDVLYVQSRSIRHGSPEVLARLARGETVDASEYTFRASTRIETAAPELDWLNKGIFISVGGRQSDGVIYETYLVE